MKSCRRMSPGCTARSFFVAIFKSSVPQHDAHASVIIDTFHVERVSILPLEAQTPLLVDPNAVLSLAITLHCFEKIRWRNQEVAQIRRTVQILQLLACPLLNLSVDALHKPTLENLLGISILERANHCISSTLKQCVINVKR